MGLIRNLGQIRQMLVAAAQSSSDPNKTPRLINYGEMIKESFDDVQKQLGNLSSQTNASLTNAQNSPPPSPNAVHVVASGGVAHIQITDNNENLYRGVQYHVQYAPAGTNFAAPITYHMGPSRDARIPVGTQLLQYRVFSDYPTSPASAPVYHGGATPIAIAATGTEQPPIPLGMGSGTGTPGEISGFGPVPWRGSSPPRRS